MLYVMSTEPTELGAKESKRRARVTKLIKTQSIRIKAYYPRTQSLLHQHVKAWAKVPDSPRNDVMKSDLRLMTNHDPTIVLERGLQR